MGEGLGGNAKFPCLHLLEAGCVTLLAYPRVYQPGSALKSWHTEFFLEFYYIGMVD